MKNKKGISMISLVITIIVIVILIGIATTAGYRYIMEGNKMQSEAVVSIISEAAYRRQNDLSAGVAVAYYEGYSFVVDENITRYEKINGLPDIDLSGDKGVAGSDGIPDCLQEDGAKWYLFDVQSAEALGVKESDKFITRNISYPSALKEEEVKLVLADYSSGKGYFIEMPKDIISDSIRQEGGCLNSPTGNHDFKIIATCTKPALCIYCGEADPLNPALGHDFTMPTCTASGICRRCGELDPDNGPLGHLMIKNADMSNTALVEAFNARECRLYPNTENGASADSSYAAAWITDALKHWHECIRCGEKTNESEHQKGNVSLDSEYHYSVCSECGWNSIKSKHVYTYESVTENTHKRTCTVCFYEETHNDTGWLNKHPAYHYRICNDIAKCYTDVLTIEGVNTNVLFKEAHYDHNNDMFCDVCGRALDYDAPNSFDSNPNYYGKMVDATTNTITVEAFTVDDGVGVDYYQFGILNPETGEIEWGEKVYPPDASKPAQTTFKDLKADTEYTIYVKATDKAGNVTPAYKIPETKTTGFPTFNGLTNIPDTYVKGPIYAGIAPIETDMKDLIIKYSQDGGTTWNEISISEINSAKITLTKETETILIKFTDSTGNESGVWEYKIEKIDATPPKVEITAKEGDDNEELAILHTAQVIISDDKSGIAPNTEVRYAWSTSKTEVPTEFTTIHTENYEDASRVSFNVNTPTGVKGDYYLWILEGVKDKVGNVTTKPVCSGIYFSIDDQETVVSNIRMEDLSPAVEKEFLFVKTSGIVTISFETDKKLGKEPEVTLNGQKVVINSSADGLTHVGTITITNDFAEGVLQLRIANIVSETGKINKTIYTNDDLTEGPVFYDKTLPVFEYISKQ